MVKELDIEKRKVSLVKDRTVLVSKSKIKELLQKLQTKQIRKKADKAKVHSTEP